MKNIKVEIKGVTYTFTNGQLFYSSNFEVYKVNDRHNSKVGSISALKLTDSAWDKLKNYCNPIKNLAGTTTFMLCL